MNKKLLLACFTVTALALSACAVKSTDTVMKTETRSGGFLGLSSKDELEVSTPKAFSSANKVVIGSFKVGFNESKTLSKKATGGFFEARSNSGKSVGHVKLEGISAAVKQQIADKAYEDFTQQLIASGYTIVPRSTFTSHTSYSGTKEYDFPYEDDHSGILSSYGVGTYYAPKQIGTKQPIFPGEIDGVSGGFGFSSPMGAAAKFGEETGIRVLNVTYFVDFAGAGGHSSMTTSSLEVGQVLSVDRGVLGITFGQGGSFSNNIGKMSLGQPIGSSVPFATIETTTSDAAVGLETTVNIASTLFGGGTNQRREFVFHANPSKYTSASLDVLHKANALFTSKMTSLR